MGNVLEWVQVTVQVTIVAYDWCGLRVCRHIINCCFLQGEIGAYRRILYAEYMASVLVNYHIGCRIVQQQKGSETWSWARTPTWRNMPSISAETAYVCLRSRKSTKVKFWSWSVPTNKDLFKDVPKNLEAPIKLGAPQPACSDLLRDGAEDTTCDRNANVNHPVRR